MKTFAERGGNYGELELIVITAATENFKAAANYALTKEENAITIDKADFTKFIGIAAPSTYIVLSILWGLL